MNQTLTIQLKKREKYNLSQLALRFGLSLPEFGRRILTELHETFSKETFEDYENLKALKASFGRAKKDLQNGRVQTSL